MPLTLDTIWQHLDSLTKPPRSLGRLEELAARMCLIQQTLRPQTRPRRLVIFAADHGVARAGVTLWPQAVTGLMVRNMCSGGAACTVLARQSGTEVVLVNVGTLEEPMADAPDLASGVVYRSRRIRSGTRNLAEEPALTAAEFDEAWNVGADEARAAAEDGTRVILAGEMGIGNTTAAACLAMLLADVPLNGAVGPGAGATNQSLAHKRDVVEQAVARARQLWTSDAQTAIASIAGLEIAAMAGLFAEAHRVGLTTVLDGAIASAAALVAQHRVLDVARSMIAAHLSAETCHRAVLQRLNLEPMLDWNMRLGEGTGALALLSLMDAAAALVGEMATLKDIGI